MAIRNRNPRRPGFTLLEVLLALALTVVLLSLLSFSISVYLRVSNAGRDEVERSQLARVLLRRMSDDLRSTLWRKEKPAASSGSSSSSSSNTGSGQSGNSSTGSAGSGSQSGGGTGGGNSAGTGGGTGANSSGSGNSSSGSSSSSTSVSDATELAAVTGLFGNQYEIQIDISRLPRVEQYASALVATNDLVSDVKTVAYFRQSASSGATNAAGGLIRREFDRAVTSYASSNGDISAWEQGLAPLAQEVTAVEFRYFDGTEWLTEWDSQAKNALPLAVEIAIQLADTAPKETASSREALTAQTSAADSGAAVYRTLVFIPQSQAPEVSGSSAFETMVAATTNASSGSGQGGPGGAGQGGQGPSGGGARGGGSSGRGGGFGNEGEGGGGRGGGGRGGRGGDDGGDGGGEQQPPADDDDDDGGAS